MPHHIEVFSGNSRLCREVIDLVTVGKCKDCTMHILDVNEGDESVQEKIRKYRVSSVPTIVIDSRIKVVGVPSFPWFCSDEFYKFLEKEHPLLLGLDK